VIRIEPDEQAKRETCPRCGGATWLTLGFIYQDEIPHGIYYLDWCEGPHELRKAFFTVSIGNYADEDATGADRISFAIEARCAGLGLLDAPIHDRPAFLGQLIPKDEALARADIDHLWHLTDHICADDPRAVALTAWLCGGIQTVLEDDSHA
jgi:hypothetical protein